MLPSRAALPRGGSGFPSAGRRADASSANASGPIRSPLAKIAAESIAFFSSRTLPGQECCRSSPAPGRDALDLRSACRRLNSAMNVVDERRDVLLALAQRRDADRDDLQPVVEVLAERAGRDRLLEIRGSSPR